MELFTRAERVRERAWASSLSTLNRRVVHIGQEVSAHESKSSQASILRHKWLPPEPGAVLSCRKSEGGKVTGPKTILDQAGTDYLIS